MTRTASETSPGWASSGDILPFMFYTYADPDINEASMQLDVSLPNLSTRCKPAEEEGNDSGMLGPIEDGLGIWADGRVRRTLLDS